MKFNYINTQYLDSVVNGDNQILSELVDMFCAQALEIHAEMIRLHEEGSHNSLGLLAHKAKSSVAIMGMDSLARDLKQFELLAREGRSADMYSAFIEKYRFETGMASMELRQLVELRTLNK